MSSDIRIRVKNILAGVTATLDDGVTAAQILVRYEGGPEVLRWPFEILGMHATIDIERPQRREEGEQRRIQDEPIRYNANVPVHVIAIDQTGVTATKLLEKIRVSLESTIEANAQQAGYTVILQQDRNRNQRIGGFDPLWRDEYTILYRPLES
jgi:hypothetical protein